MVLLLSLKLCKEVVSSRLRPPVMIPFYRLWQGERSIVIRDPPKAGDKSRCRPSLRSGKLVPSNIEVHKIVLSVSDFRGISTSTDLVKKAVIFYLDEKTARAFIFDLDRRWY